VLFLYIKAADAVIHFGGFIMKRIILAFTLAFFAVTLASAHSGDSGRRNFFPQRPSFSKWQAPPRNFQQNRFSYNLPQRNTQTQIEREVVNVDGNLTIVRGVIAVSSGDTTYFVRGLSRFVGFIDGFKDGAAIKLEGVAISNPQDKNVKFLRAEKMNFNGKDYELAINLR